MSGDEILRVGDLLDSAGVICNQHDKRSATTTTVARKSTTAPLMPARYSQGDLFVADILDVAPKGDRASMEHPFFALRAGDKKPRVYEHNGAKITVFPGHRGLATIHDKDILIFCASQLVEARNRGRSDMGRVVTFTAYDFLVATNRDTGGRGYREMHAALNRLAGTRIETNIKTGGRLERSGFGLLDEWHVVEEESGKMVAVAVTLPRWFYRAIENNEVLTLDRAYFRLRRPLDRRLYEIARKHVGHQASWKVSVEVLMRKTGSRSTVRKFRQHLREVQKNQHLPGYRIVFDRERDMVVFYSRSKKGGLKQLNDLLSDTMGKKTLKGRP